MATPVEWLNEFQVNTGTADLGSVSDVQVIGLSNGNFLVAWTEFGTAGVGTQPGNDIIGKIFDAEGNLVRDSYRLNANRTADNEGDFDIAATNDGGFILVFMDDDISTPGDTEVIYQRHSSNGNSTGTVSLLAETTANFEFSNPQITVNLQDNTSVLQFQNQVSGGDTGIYLRTLDANGAITNSGSVNDDATSNEFDGDIAMLSNGNVVSVWTDSSGGDSVQLRVQTSTGGAVAGPITVDGTGRNAQVTALANGGFVVAYENYNVNNGGISIGRYDASGTLLGFTTAASTTDNENEPDIIALPDGDFIVVWDNDTDGTLEARRFNENGTADGTLFIVENVGPTEPTISVTGDGRVVFAWVEQATGNIYSSIWDPRSNPVDGADYDNNTRIFLDSTVLTSLTTSSTVNGTNANDTILGQGGNDLLIGESGVDTIRGGGGNDTIRGGLGTDNLFGDTGNDRFEIFNGEFSDNIDGGIGTDTLDLDARTTGSGANVDLRNGTYTLQGAANTITSVETVLGTQLNDTLRGNSGSTLFGNNGNDTFDFRIGDGTPDFNGGFGTDTADFSTFGATNFYIDLAGGGYRFGATTAGAYSGALTSTENYVGGGGIDVVIGSSDANDLRGNLGNDELFGNGGSDDLYGGNGDDTMHGGGGNEFMNGGGDDDTMFGDGGLDTMFGGIGNDYMEGGVGIDDMNGGTGNDTMYGDGGNDVMNGAAGNDVMFGGDQNDRMGGQGGVDTLRGENGNDFITGGDQNDTLFGGSGNDRLYGQADDDTMYGEAGIDYINGDIGNDFADGGSGDDRLFGGGDNDTLLGGANNDLLVGGTGIDFMDGGSGNDRMRGDDGFDTFRFLNGFGDDRVLDFENDIDTIQLDDALWGGGLNVAQVLNTFGTQVAFNRYDLDFGVGESIIITGRFGAGVSAADLVNDILII